MRNFTEMGYETITVIRSEYPPQIGKCLSISPVLWIQNSEKEDGSKEEKRYFVFAKNNCIKQIYEIGQALNDYIDGIITPCGNILPINNKVEFLDSEGIGLECVEGKLKFVIKAPLDSSLGGTGFITYNDGDILVGNQDGKLSILLKGQIGQALGIKEDGTVGYIDILKKLTCDGSDSVTENALTRWNADGKCLKDSKTVQDDDGTTETTSTVDGELKQLIDNLSSSDSAGVVQHLRSLVKTMIRQEIKDKQIWDSYIDTTSKSYVVRGENLEDLTQKGDYLELTTYGNLNIPLQWNVFAIHDFDSPRMNAMQQLNLGEKNKLNLIINEGNNFFPGNGQGQSAYYEFKDNHTLLAYMVFIIQKTQSSQTELQAFLKLRGSRTKDWESLSIIPNSFGKNTVTLLAGIKGIKNDKIYFSLVAANTTWYITQFRKDTYQNYVGLYRLP